MNNKKTFADYITPVVIIDNDITYEEEERKGRKIMRNVHGSQTIYATISEGTEKD